MESTMIGASVNTILTAIAVFMCVRWARDAIAVSHTKVTELPPDDDAIQQQLKELVSGAEHEILAYDDSASVLEAIGERASAKDLKNVCCVWAGTPALLNQRPELLRDIKIVAEPEGAVSDLHYEIVDRRKALISRLTHELGAPAKKALRVDCSEVLPAAGELPAALQSLFADFEQRYPDVR